MKGKLGTLPIQVMGVYLHRHIQNKEKVIVFCLSVNYAGDISYIINSRKKIIYILAERNQSHSIHQVFRHWLKKKKVAFVSPVTGLP